MEKTYNSISSIDFLDFAYSPTNQEQDEKQNLNQRIINPKKKKITTYGSRIIKDENTKNEEPTIKILRRKISN